MRDLVPYVQKAFPAIHKTAMDRVSASGALDFTKEAQAGAARQLLEHPGLWSRIKGVFRPGTASTSYERQIPGIAEDIAGSLRGEQESAFQALEHQLASAERQAARVPGMEGELASLRESAKAPGGGGGASGHLGRLGRWGLPLSLGAGAIGVPTAYYMGQGFGQDESHRDKMLAFGGGAAAGLFAPRIIRGLTSTAQNLGLTPGQGGYY